MKDIFQALSVARAGAKLGADMEGRNNYPSLAIVTQNKDPLGRRRIRCADPVVPALETEWLMRSLSHANFDPPLPVIGSTVLVFWVDGDPLNGFYQAVVNDTNPAHDKADKLKDFSEIVQGQQVERTERDRVVSVGESLTLRNDAGASIELAANGDIVLSDASGNSITLAGGISFGTSSLEVGGKQIVVVGAKDSANHPLIEKGW